MSDVKAAQPAPEFTGWRNYLWPIQNYELKKFLPMGLMMFFILFNYTLMRDTKDTLVINAPCSGAEVVSFLKLFGVLPSAMLFMLIYVKMCNALSSERIFYVIISAFMVFFGLFGFVLYPNVDMFHASVDTIEGWRHACPGFLYWPLAAVGNWCFCLFYIMAEMWGSLVISMLFWQFANATTKVTESKRFYAFYGLIGNFGLICSAKLMQWGAAVGDAAKASGGGSGYADNLRILMIGVVLACVLIMVIYSWIQKNVLTDPKFFDPSQIKKKKEKLKLSLGQSLSCIFKSSYLGLILVLVLGYNVCINLVELTWKSQIKLKFLGDTNGYSRFMSYLSESTGYFTIFFTLIGMNILRRCSWRTAALVNPLIVLFSSVPFFLLLNFSRTNDPHMMITFMGMSTALVSVTVWIGLVQNVLCKGTKYSLFDSTKQMAYIPLDPEMKSKGQAAVEVVGGRFGKSGGAMIQAFLLAICGSGTTLLSLSPILGVIVVIIDLFWLAAVFGLNKKFTALTAQREKEAQEAKENSQE